MRLVTDLQQLHMLFSDRMPFNASRHIPLHFAWGQHECCYIACLQAQGFTSEPFWCRAAMEQSV